MAARDEMNTAPDCPWWCTEHSNNPSWTVDVGGSIKLCKRRVECVDDLDGTPVRMTVQRFAELLTTGAQIDEPVIHIEATAALSTWGAGQIAATLTRVAELVNEPATLAA